MASSALSVSFADSLWHDTRYAIRTLRNKPAFAATALLTLALALGGNTVMFTVIRAVLLKPLPYSNPDRLVSISGGATPTRFAEMKANARSFVELGAFIGPENITLSGAGEPEVLKAVRVSAGFLQIPAVEPILGRSFRPDEDSAAGGPVAMISAELWQRRFAADLHIVGKTATLESTAYTIIGVLPRRFRFPLPGIDVWMTAPSEEPLIPPKSRALSPYLTVFGRLKPGMSIEQANAEMKVIRHQYALAHPAMLDARPKPVEVAPMKDELVAKVRSMLWMLFGAVGLVLLIACANVAGLLIARATSRTREFAVRSALGAPRNRLIRQLLAESILLSLIGGAVGLLVAAWGLSTIPKIIALDLPRAGEIQLDWVVFGFSAALALATGIAFGLAPSLGASRPDLMATLRAAGEVGSQAAPGRILAAFNIRGLLVAGQIALSIVLLIGAALLVESIAHLRRVDVGFNPSNLLTIRITLPPLRYQTDEKKNAVYDELIRRAEALPGIHSGAAASILPMMGQPGTPVQNAAQPPRRLNERPIEGIIGVTPGYFRTLEIPLKRGRDFNAQDRADSQRVAIVDEGLVRQFWPSYPDGADPVGQRLLVGGINPKPAEIIGIVGNLRQNLEGNAWPGTVYEPFTQGAPQSALFAIRTEGDPLRFANSLRDQVRMMDRDEPIADVATMDDLVEAQVGQRRLLMIVLESFAGVALLLALIGIYGVIAYAVAQRTKEVGIRRALGAEHGDILWLIVRDGAAMVLLGIALGLGGAFALTRLLSALLYGVTAADPVTFAAVAFLFLIVSLAAGYVPARRAARIDPMQALRL